MKDLNMDELSKIYSLLDQCYLKDQSHQILRVIQSQVNEKNVSSAMIFYFGNQIQNDTLWKKIESSCRNRTPQELCIMYNVCNDFEKEEKKSEMIEMMIGNIKKENSLEWMSKMDEYPV